MGRRGRWWEAGRAVCEGIRVQGEEESRAGRGKQARVCATMGESRGRALLTVNNCIKVRS
jgi:hypothetical protein